MEIAKRNREIKKRLQVAFGKKNVRVWGHRGTAYGWVSVDLTVVTNPDCTCHLSEDNYSCCWKCKEYRRMIERLVYQNIRGLEIGTYTCDDGYGTERDEMHINIEKVKPVEKSAELLELEALRIWKTKRAA